MAPVVHGLEAEYYDKVQFAFLDVDDPANDPTFTKMDQLGLLGASIHISQPYPTKWCENPVKFWQAHNAWERVLDRHPCLKVVNAHMLDHFSVRLKQKD